MEEFKWLRNILQTCGPVGHGHKMTLFTLIPGTVLKKMTLFSAFLLAIPFWFQPMDHTHLFIKIWHLTRTTIVYSYISQLCFDSHINISCLFSFLYTDAGSAVLFLVPAVSRTWFFAPWGSSFILFVKRKLEEPWVSSLHCDSMLLAKTLSCSKKEKNLKWNSWHSFGPQ